MCVSLAVVVGVDPESCYFVLHLVNHRRNSAVLQPRLHNSDPPLLQGSEHVVWDRSGGLLGGSVV
jgi:hypothetical protein